MFKGYKYRIKPTKAQELKLNQFFGCGSCQANISELLLLETKNPGLLDRE
jgi:hypothetical protein